MPRARLAKNRDLPPRWHWHHGAIYFMVPTGQEAAWGGKKKFRLGATKAEAYKVFAARLEAIEKAVPEVARHHGIRNIGEALDHYFLVASSQKAEASRKNDENGIKQLKHVFGHMPLKALTTSMVHDYVQHRAAFETAKKEVFLLSCMYDYADAWGLVKENPIKGKMKWKMFAALKKAGKRRKHYVTDEDFLNAALCGEEWMWAYLSLKLATALRGEDMRQLKCNQVTDDGLVTLISKDGDRDDGVRVRIYELGDLTLEELRTQVGGRPGDAPLFPHPETGGHFTKREFQWRWDKMMNKHVAKGGRRFNEHLVRGKSGSEPDLEMAVELLGHRSERVTMDHYRLKPERVPALGR